jgi:cellulose synthase/poly-beta-1,6-N-acetylglucosamine synthase-like glycosyltransferase
MESPRDSKVTVCMNGTETILASVFWLSVAAIAYAYVGYPALISVAARLFGRSAEPRAATADEDLPHVSLLIAAHNEEAVIDARVRNALATDYPAEKLEIVVASDGSSDATAAIVRRYASRGVRLLHDPQRKGKAATINAVIPQLSGEIIVLSDANTDVDPAAIRRLAHWFADPAIGAVCGRLVLTDAATGGNADGIYWRYETFLKRCEGRLGALLGANGAIYAIRRELFVPIPPTTIIDDFVIPLLSKLKNGGAIVYESSATACEETAPDVRSEFRRRARIGAGGFQAIGLLWRLSDPRRGWIALAFVSHKVLRWCGPFFMLGSAIASACLSRHAFYRQALMFQAGFYAVSLAGALWPARSPRLLRVAQLFTGMNAALLVGFWRWWNGAQGATWQPTARPVELRRAA